MKVVIQRVEKASVRVGEEMVGSIEKGLLLLVGIHKEDGPEEMEWLCNKVLNLRIFCDEKGKMNLSVQDTGGELLIVSQFTLYGRVQKGNRPSYTDAAGPEKAEELYERMIQYFKEVSGLKVESGKFGAHMNVELTNSGPVTIVAER